MWAFILFLKSANARSLFSTASIVFCILYSIKPRLTAKHQSQGLSLRLLNASTLECC
jgi:hypothetical protein